MTTCDAYILHLLPLVTHDDTTRSNLAIIYSVVSLLILLYISPPYKSISMDKTLPSALLNSVLYQFTISSGGAAYFRDGNNLSGREFSS